MNSSSRGREHRAGVVGALMLLGFLFCPPSLKAQYGDAQRGAETLRERQCVLCHPIAGVGGSGAPDLARRSPRDFTPAALAASMWNHGPRMWSAMAARGVEVPPLTSEEISDLYVYFYSLRYFDPPGDAGRGKAVFAGKNCHRCHSLIAHESAGPGPPVPEWPAIGNLVLWIQHMWNHGSQMAAEFKRQGIGWPKFTVREMADLMVYVQNLPGLPPRAATLRLGNPTAGEQVFDAHGCIRCHSLGEDSVGKTDLLSFSRELRTMAGLAVAMWNHQPVMARRTRLLNLEMQPFEGQDMEHVVSYLLQEGYFTSQGNPRRGNRVFRAKRCDSCHGQADSDAPDLGKFEPLFSAPRLASVVWRHGPKMLEQMRSRGIAWPEFSAREMADLIAFLNSP